MTSFLESFRGDGQFTSVDGNIEGLNAPGWSISQYLAEPGSSVSVDEIEVTETGLQFSNTADGFNQVMRTQVSHAVKGLRSFTEEVAIDGLLFDIATGNPDASAGLRLWHEFEPPQGLQGFGLTLSLGNDLTGSSEFAYVEGNGPTVRKMVVPLGQNIAFGIDYDDDTGLLTTWYDNNTRDDISRPYGLTPIVYDGWDVFPQHTTQLSISAWTRATANGILEHWKLRPVSDVVGDFSGNQELDLADVELLTVAILNSTADEVFDLDGNKVVDQQDLTYWIHELKQTVIGDADLDGQFSSADLINVFQAGEYEDAIFRNSTWSTGDWNGDGEFTTGDLVVAFQDGGYEQSPQAAAYVVPEPSGMLGLLSSGLGLAAWRRNKSGPDPNANDLESGGSRHPNTLF
ncbi:MAG: PEP-CTERM sorting domain-containing protein [Planctomycetales bacterium]|nr:PEP-CTERM sorting domain-containing protein [Planctomycetales bacterium]